MVNTKIKVAASIAGIIYLIYLLGAGDREILAKVKSGEYDLMCGIDSWEQNTYIDPDLVTGFSSDIGSGTWTFINGYASNCKLVRGE